MDLEFVNQVLEIIELDEIKDALVGVPGVSGLSTEQRKRLTIAVELVANPSIIFMDEPTSGLDAQAAAIVMLIEFFETIWRPFVVKGLIEFLKDKRERDESKTSEAGRVAMEEETTTNIREHLMKDKDTTNVLKGLIEFLENKIEHDESKARETERVAMEEECKQQIEENAIEEWTIIIE
ncbi:uncharacterized protein LOC116118455 [Pistacia vera]|uniref:uncharacterized protein LOC116118455 n=1 Tax=Pistacia vera TaxID=55513 RepID=UPI0012633EAA|nr:uncharacterized protein LOC116118455 [Pistacia vera]